MSRHIGSPRTYTYTSDAVSSYPLAQNWLTFPSFNWLLGPFSGGPQWHSSDFKMHFWGFGARQETWRRTEEGEHRRGEGSEKFTLWHKIITYEKLFWNNYFSVQTHLSNLQVLPLKTLTSLNKEVRPFFLCDNSIWSFPSVSFLSDYSTWRFWRLF